MKTMLQKWKKWINLFYLHIHISFIQLICRQYDANFFFVSLVCTVLVLYHRGDSADGRSLPEKKGSKRVNLTSVTTVLGLVMRELDHFAELKFELKKIIFLNSNETVRVYDKFI